MPPTGTSFTMRETVYFTEMNGRKHFVLVHGACLGAWCWYKLVTQLKLAGHRVTALDLDASGVKPSRLNEIASFSDYVEPLMDFMASLPGDEKVVLVGHSYGGLPISHAMENCPEKISLAVFLSAYMPNCAGPPGLLIQEFFKRTSMESFLDCEFKFDRGMDKPAPSVIFGPKYMEAKLFLGCPPEDLELAKLLIRPAGLFVEDMMNYRLTDEKFGSVNRVFIICKDDDVMEEEFQAFMIKNSPPKEVAIIQGARHMVMLSKPNQLCLSLVDIAGRYY